VGGETDWPDDYIFEEIAIQSSKSFYRLGGRGGGGGGGCHRLYLQKYCKAYEQRWRNSVQRNQCTEIRHLVKKNGISGISVDK
jgi:hypothetical protein